MYPQKSRELVAIGSPNQLHKIAKFTDGVRFKES
jgi:hypothetical protein